MGISEYVYSVSLCNLCNNTIISSASEITVINCTSIREFNALNGKSILISIEYINFQKTKHVMYSHI